eukprot:206532_1
MPVNSKFKPPKHSTTKPARVPRMFRVLLLWLYPLVVFVLVCGVAIRSARDLTVTGAREERERLAGGLGAERPLIDRFLPPEVDDLDSIVNSSTVDVMDTLTFAPYIFAIFWIIFEKDRFVWATTLGSNTLLFGGKSIAKSLTILPDSKGALYCTKILERWERYPTQATFLFCRDMMWSGHTVMSLVATCALVRMAYRHGHKYALLRPEWSKHALFGCMVSVNCACMVLLLQTRAHYSVDIFMAVLMTILVFSNEILQRTIASVFCVSL